MHSIHQLTAGVIAEIIQRQPSSPARTTFAWQLAVGPALAKSTSVDLADGVLTVRSSDPRWTLEVNRARGMVLGACNISWGRSRSRNSASSRNQTPAEAAAPMNTRESVIISAVRTPTGRFLGVLKDFAATELGAQVVREAVRRSGIDPATVDECIMGNVIQAGNGQTPRARRH